MNWRKIIFHKTTIWVGLALAAVLTRVLLCAGAIERYYSRGVFPVVRSAFDAVTGWVPFALVYPLFFLLLFLGVRGVIRFFKSKTPWVRRLFAAGLNTLALASAVVFFFLLLWGFNYGRTPVEDTIGIKPEPLTISELKMELDSATAAVLRTRALLPAAPGSAVPADLMPEDLENIMRQELVKHLGEFGYATPGKVRGRLLFPKGILLRISTAGVYIPFTGEGHIDAGLHHLQLPFVVVHEMSHGYGFGDEGTCTQSDDPFLRYVGHLYYWRYVASDYRDYLPQEYEKFRETLPEGVKNDLLAIRQEMEKYPDILPWARDAAYAAYLHAQGISEGLKNYDRVTMLVHAWRVSR
jgi:hypothetical protein